MIDDNDFLMAQDRDAMKMTLEDRVQFLSTIPLFKKVDTYKLTRYATSLVQEEINKGTVLTSHGGVSKDMFFVLNGKIDVLKNVKKRFCLSLSFYIFFYGYSFIFYFVFWLLDMQ